MTKIYTLSKAVFTTAVLLALNMANAQTPTTVTDATGSCGVISENFNAGPGRFTSPSIYAGTLDRAFFYDAAAGNWNESAGTGTTPSGNRVVNIISPLYTNPNPVGQIIVGFSFTVPNANEQYQIRVISVSGSGLTVNVVANTTVTGLRTFGSTSGNICLRLVDPDITNTTPYRIEITYVLNGAGSASFDNFSLGPILASPLPVDFLGLFATRNSNNSVTLKWDVANEKNVKEYEVERSDNGSTFNKIGSVPTNSKNVYSFIDNSAGIGTIFYRVRNIDIDGQSKYSSILRLQGINSYGNVLRMYPIPARTEATIEHKQLAQNAKITITTTDGRVVRTITPSAGASHTPVDLSGIAAGSYILRLDDGKGKIETLKFVKQ
ncbi:MAG: T9SS type A sorting domain-containing protein [Bacteroidota bacterium]|nr:T9SS type A sorting domain-containing protein [Bacteroidota bacterium]